MAKSDKSKHNICVAAIKRHILRPYDFKWTKFYENNVAFGPECPIQFLLHQDELAIASTIIDDDNFSILTSQRLTTKEKGLEISVHLNGANSKSFGHCKGLKDPFTFGIIETFDGVDVKYFIETGRASMVMITGVHNLITLSNAD